MWFKKILKCPKNLKIHGVHFSVSFKIDLEISLNQIKTNKFIC
jgi:hypothetical protein